MARGPRVLPVLWEGKYKKLPKTLLKTQHLTLTLTQTPTLIANFVANLVDRIRTLSQHISLISKFYHRLETKTSRKRLLAIERGAISDIGKSVLLRTEFDGVIGIYRIRRGDRSIFGWITPSVGSSCRTRVTTVLWAFLNTRPPQMMKKIPKNEKNLLILQQERSKCTSKHCRMISATRVNIYPLL